MLVIPLKSHYGSSTGGCVTSLRCLCSALCRPPFKKQAELTGKPDSFFRGTPAAHFLPEAKCIESISPRLAQFGFAAAMPFEGASADIAVGVTDCVRSTKLIDIKSTIGDVHRVWHSVPNHPRMKWDAVTCLQVKHDPDSLEVRPEKARVRVAGDENFHECRLDEALQYIMESSAPTFHCQEALRLGLTDEYLRAFVAFQKIKAFFMDHGCSYEMYPIKNYIVDSIIVTPGVRTFFVQEKSARFLSGSARGQVCNLKLAYYAGEVDVFVVRARCPLRAAMNQVRNDAPFEWTGVFGCMDALREGIDHFYAYPPTAQNMFGYTGKNVRFNAHHVVWIHDSSDARLKYAKFQQIQSMLQRIT